MQASAAVRRFAPTALMLGNLVTGCAVLAPAGMLKQLSEGLDVSVSSAIRWAQRWRPCGSRLLCGGLLPTIASKWDRHHLELR